MTIDCPGLTIFQLMFFDCILVQKQYAFSRRCTQNFDLFLGYQYVVLCSAVMLGSGSELHLTVSHAVITDTLPCVPVLDAFAQL